MKIFKFFLLLIFIINFAYAHSPTSGEKNFRDNAIKKYNIDKKTLNTFFHKVKKDKSILKAFERPNTAKPWYFFKNLFITEKRINDGNLFYEKHNSTLVSSFDKFGVSKEIIVSIIGIETNYGNNKGTSNVADALYTLGFHAKRRNDFFKKELMNFFVLAKKNNLDLFSIKGSYAGALGYPQFMPSSYLNYAIDFDNDLLVDLFNSVEDSIGSVANYLKVHGWNKDKPVVLKLPVLISNEKIKDHKKISSSFKNFKKKFSLDNEFKQEFDSLKISAFNVEDKSGLETWVAFKNFHVIKKYNNSTNYALAVYLLSKSFNP